MATIPVDERFAIQELTYLYAFYCDTRGYEKLAQLFADECLYDEAVVGGAPAKSRAEVHQLFINASQRLGPMIHICSNLLISEFSGSAASGICYVLAEGLFNIDGAQESFRIFGYYEDGYAKEADNHWYFKSRVLKLLVPSQGAPTVGGITYDAIRQVSRWNRRAETHE